MTLPFDFGYEVLNKLYEKTAEQRAWERWVAHYPHMREPMPFSEFWGSFKLPIYHSKRPTEEILREAEEIQRKIQGQKAGE